LAINIKNAVKTTVDKKEIKNGARYFIIN
jgi:hypothetical protein